MKQLQSRLLEFLKIEFSELLKKKNVLHPSKTSSSVIGKLYNLIIKADASFTTLCTESAQLNSSFSLKHPDEMNILNEKRLNKNKRSIKIGELELKSKQDDFLIDSFIPAEIAYKIKNSSRYQQTYLILHNGDTYNINFVYPIMNLLETRALVQRFFQDSIYKIYLWLYVSDKYASKSCSNTMNLRFYFSDHLKILGEVDLETLDTVHVNTAFTTSCSNITEIQLFRREEWFKVFIHETFHNLGLDFSEMDDRKTDEKMNTIFPLNVNFKIYEAYCETWAETIHILFLLFFKGYDLSTALSKFETVLHYETVYSCFQCIKTLNYYKITYDQLTNKTDHISKTAREKYKENTPVFSYYIIKTVLLLSWNDFMEWCSKHNTNILQFNKTQRTQLSFVDLIFKLYKSERILSNLTYIENWYAHSNILNDALINRIVQYGQVQHLPKKNATSNQYILRNLRMTLHG